MLCSQHRRPLILAPLRCPFPWNRLSLQCSKERVPRRLGRSCEEMSTTPGACVLDVVQHHLIAWITASIPPCNPAHFCKHVIEISAAGVTMAPACEGFWFWWHHVTPARWFHWRHTKNSQNPPKNTFPWTFLDTGAFLDVEAQPPHEWQSFVLSVDYCLTWAEAIFPMVEEKNVKRVGHV